MNIYVTSEQVGLEGYWMSDVLSGIDKESIKKNLTVIDYNGQKLKTNDEFVRPLVLAVGYSSQWMEDTCIKMKNSGVEPILISAAHDSTTEMLGASGFASFSIKKAMYNVLNYLISGHRTRVAFFGGHEETHSDNVKAANFLEVSRYFGLNILQNDIYKDTSLLDCAKSLELSLHRYNAVVCTSDTAAVFLIKWLEERGVKVPEDIFVIGFGNSITAKQITPSVTIAACDFAQLGRQAVKLHQFLQHNPDISSNSVLVDCPIIERESTAALKFKKMHIQSIHDGSMPLYDTDNDVKTVLQIEELLRMWDDIDKSIIKGLFADKTIVAIADGLFISVSAVKYRIKKMLITADLKSKEELIKIIKKYDVIGQK
jgi:DNA-binding LacI/PurR family transcriptional regulator